MEQRDFIQKQIDKLGRVLGEILIRLLGQKSSSNINEVINSANQTLKYELDFDVKELVSIETENLIDFLKVGKHLSNENLDKLAEILLIIADIKYNDIEKPEMLYKQCLTILLYLEKVESTYSFDRHLKIERIKKVL